MRDCEPKGVLLFKGEGRPETFFYFRRDASEDRVQDDAGRMGRTKQSTSEHKRKNTTQHFQIQIIYVTTYKYTYEYNTLTMRKF